jgi:hypothetical protein
VTALRISVRLEVFHSMTHAQNSRGLWPFLVNGNLLRDSLQFGARENQQGETVIDTGKNASNPGIIELTVAACNPASGTRATTASDPELWAALMHQLCRAPHYRDTLALALQMHLAKLTEEYVLPHDPDAD